MLALAPNENKMSRRERERAWLRTEGLNSRKAGPNVLMGWCSTAPIPASAACTRAMTNATVKSPVRERASTTATLASANERLLLAAYIALTCTSPDDDRAATEKPTLVNALPVVTNAQRQKKRDFI